MTPAATTTDPVATLLEGADQLVRQIDSGAALADEASRRVVSATQNYARAFGRLTREVKECLAAVGQIAEDALEEVQDEARKLADRIAANFAPALDPEMQEQLARRDALVSANLASLRNGHCATQTPPNAHPTPTHSAAHPPVTAVPSVGFGMPGLDDDSCCLETEGARLQLDEDVPAPLVMEPAKAPLVLTNPDAPHPDEQPGDSDVAALEEVALSRLADDGNPLTEPFTDEVGRGAPPTATGENAKQAVPKKATRKRKR